MSDTQEERTELTLVQDKGAYDTTLDNYLTNVCLMRTMGDVAHAREVATNAKQYTVASMIFNAVIECDVELIRTIALRIDGTIPEEDKRDGFANLIGAALEDVLSYDQATQMQITSEDLPIIAMAKALVYVATQPCGKNFAKRKERNLAAQMILERCGGRKVKPTMIEARVEYVEPEWMQLPNMEGEQDGEGENRETEDLGQAPQVGR